MYGVISSGLFPSIGYSLWAALAVGVLYMLLVSFVFCFARIKHVGRAPLTLSAVPGTAR